MGWSNDGQTTLVLPTGATTGPRIELNGITGRIIVYGETDSYKIVIDPNNSDTGQGPTINMTAPGMIDPRAGIDFGAASGPRLVGIPWLSVDDGEEVRSYVSCGEPGIVAKVGSSTVFVTNNGAVLLLMDDQARLSFNPASAASNWVNLDRDGVHVWAGDVDGCLPNINLEGNVKSVTRNYQSILCGLKGVRNLTFAAATNVTSAVAFSTAFPAGRTPMVTTNINDASAASQYWCSKATAVTNVGFTLDVQRNFGAPAVAWNNISVQWMAIDQA